MRNKFTDLINQGVAEFNYTPITGELPEQDPICRMYNNIFSIPSDTHMSCAEDGTRLITGHMIATPDWGAFLNATYWGAVNFRTAGCWCLSDFLYSHNLEGYIGIINGDVVYIVTPRQKSDELASTPTSVVTTESRVPQPISTLTKSGNMMHITECFGGTIDDTVKKLNESSWVKGNNWVPTKNGIIGLVGNTTYVIDLVNEAHEYHRYSLETKEYNGGISLTVWDCQFDSHWTAHINDIGEVTYYSNSGFSKNFAPVYRFLENMEKGIKGFDWAMDLKCPMAYTITMPGPWADKDWKLHEYPGYEIFMGITSCGQLKKKRR